MKNPPTALLFRPPHVTPALADRNTCSHVLRVYCKVHVVIQVPTDAAAVLVIKFIISAPFSHYNKSLEPKRKVMFCMNNGHERMLLKVKVKVEHLL